MAKFRVHRVDIIETDTTTFRDQPVDATLLADRMKAQALDNEGAGQELIDVDTDEVVCEYTEMNESIVVEQIDG